MTTERTTGLLTPLETAIAAVVLQASVPDDETADWVDHAHAHDAARRITRLFLEGPLHEGMVDAMVEELRDTFGRVDDWVLTTGLLTAAIGEGESL